MAASCVVLVLELFLPAQAPVVSFSATTTPQAVVQPPQTGLSNVRLMATSLQARSNSTASVRRAPMRSENRRKKGKLRTRPTCSRDACDPEANVPGGPCLICVEHLRAAKCELLTTGDSIARRRPGPSFLDLLLLRQPVRDRLGKDCCSPAAARCKRAESRSACRSKRICDKPTTANKAGLLHPAANCHHFTRISHVITSIDHPSGPSSASHLPRSHFCKSV